MKIIDLIKSEFLKNYTLTKNCTLVLIIVLSIVGITYFNELGIYDQTGYVAKHLDYVENQLNHLSLETSQKSIGLDFEKHLYQKERKLLQDLKKLEKYKEIEYDSWQSKVLNKILLLEALDFWIENHLEDQSFIEWVRYQNKYYEISDNMERLKELDYDYVFLQLGDSSEIEGRENYYQIMIQNKIEKENDYRVKNIYQRYDLGTAGYSNNRVNKLLDKKMEEAITILDYSIKNGIKQDITYSNGGVSISANHQYLSTKSCVNQILNLSVIVMVLVVLTSGDIVSREHSKNTEKLVLTSPNKRWKILFSKFIYMILHMYIIWFITFILLMIYAGMKYGFEDLLTPKLIYQNGSVVEVNYLLYMIKEIMICSIPVIAMISVLFMLSTVTLNTTITIGVSMVMIVLSPFLWHFIQQYGLAVVAYTPFPYFMFSQVMYLSENYLKTMALANISASFGIMISVITIVICYFISNTVFIKRDIKH